MRFTVIAYRTQAGRTPFREWLDTLKDVKTAIRIESRLGRVEGGNLGDFRSVGDGVFELRLPFGPGYRIYFSRERHAVILLFAGGHKGTQLRDIAYAKELHREYQETVGRDHSELGRHS